jgi:hypothetical protein
MQRNTILHHVRDEHAFQNSELFFYRLHCHQTPHIMNSYRVWTERVDDANPTPLALLQRLKSLFAKTIESAVTDPATGTVNYKQAPMLQPQYSIFEEAICE